MLDFILSFRQLLPIYFILITIVISFLCIFTLYGPQFWSIIPAITTYGKSFEETLDTTGFVRAICVPKRFFRHFYAIGLANTLLWIGYATWPEDVEPIQDFLKMMTEENGSALIPNTTGHLCLLLIFFHVARRFYETHYICVYSTSQMNILHYILGIVHYLVLPITIVCETDAVASNHRNLIPSLYDITLFQWSAMIFFVFCNFKQFQVAKQIAETRTNSRGQIRDYRYEICYGGMFDLVSCPHFLFEILIYVSILIIIPFCYAYKFLLLFVVINQMFAAEITHRWYIKKFGSKYPRSRKALIPYIF